MTGPTALALETAEQPDVLTRMLDRLLPRADELRARGPGSGDVRGIVVAARGSSDNVARYAQYLWSVQHRLPVTLATPSLQTVYGVAPDLSGQLVVAISQSGSSPDVVGVLAAARDQGRPAVAVSNEPDSDLAAAASVVVDLGAGAERSVAATKTYTGSLLAVALLGAAWLGEAGQRRRGLDQLRTVPAAVAALLERLTGSEAVAAAASVLGPHDRGIAVGRGLNLSTAHEVALKVTELAGTLVSPYSPADLRHGPLGAVGRGTPVLLVMPDEPASASVAALASDLASRRAPVVAIADPAGPGGEVLATCAAGLPLDADPGVPGWLSPLLAVLPGQLLAARLAAARGVDVDRPGGLAKVTRTS